MARPRYLHVPPAASNAADDVIGLATSAGLDLDEPEQLVLRAALGERADGTWAAPQVGLVVPRQNLKTYTIGADALGSIYVLKIPLIMWTAHRFSTAIEAWRWMRSIVTNYDHLRRRVQGVRRTTWGGGEIELLDGCRILFGSRSNGATGRGFSIDKLYLDEAFDLTDDDLAALLPALSARPNHQVWYASSAPKPHSEVLRRICLAGRAGETRGLAYAEWCAPDDATSDDQQAWAQANPAYRVRITEETIRSELATMSDLDFRRERLGIWAPESGRTIDPAQWQRLQDPRSARSGDVTIGVEIGRDRLMSAVAVFGLREDGLEHAALVDYRPGTDWLVGRLAELVEALDPIGVAMGRGTAASLEPELLRVGITRPERAEEPRRGELAVMSATETAAACGQMVDAIRGQMVDGRRVAALRVVPSPPLDAAARAADTRSVGGDGMAWATSGEVEMAPLGAVTRARWLFGAWAPLVEGNDYDVLMSVY